MDETGDFFLQAKHPKAVEAAFRRKGSKEARLVADRPKKSRSTDERALLESETRKSLPAWLKKLEQQLLIKDSGYDLGAERFVRSGLFERWARKSGALTKELSDSEYFRLVAGETPPRSREAVLEEIRQGQLNEYESWLRYLLTGPGVGQYQPWFRYAVLSEITKHDDRGRRRDADTGSGVVQFSANPLALVYDDMEQLVQQYRTADEEAAQHALLEPSETGEGREQRKALRKAATSRKTDALNALTSYPFHEKYLGYLAAEQTAANEKLGYADGWHTFADPRELALVSRGTPWCFAGLKTAKDYCADGGIIRLYFESGRPKIGISVRDGQVREVRGSEDQQQNLDPAYTSALASELSSYENARTWQKQMNDTHALGVIAAKVHEDPRVALTKEELRFLYEFDAPIKGFGLNRDPRIEAILTRRNLKEDAPVVLGCTPEEIAWSEEALNERTKVYIGPLFPGVFRLPLEHILTSFPEGRVTFPPLKVGDRATDPLTRKEHLKRDLRKALEEGVFDHMEGAGLGGLGVEKFIDSEAFVIGEPETVSLVKMRVSELGFTEPTSFEEICRRAEELGLYPVPLDVGARLRIAYPSQRQMESLSMAAKPIPGNFDIPCVFSLSYHHGKRALQLSGIRGKEISTGYTFVFQRKVARSAT